MTTDDLLLLTLVTSPFGDVFFFFLNVFFLKSRKKRCCCCRLTGTDGMIVIVIASGTRDQLYDSEELGGRVFRIFAGRLFWQQPDANK